MSSRVLAALGLAQRRDLADHGDRPVDADVRLHLQSLSPAVVGLLRERPGAAPLVAAIVTGGFWLSAADLEDLARRRLSDLADDAWRAAHPGEVDRAVGQAYRLGAEAAPTLRRLEGVEGVNQESLALARLVLADPYALRALARLGDDRCIPGLLALLAVDDPDARAFAARGIRDLGRPEPVARLVEAAVDDTEDDVAWIAAHAAVVAGVEATALLDQLGAANDDAVRLVEHWRTKVAPPEESRGPVVS